MQLASKQATTSSSLLAITPAQRFRLHSSLAILEPRWCPCQIQFLSQKLTDGAPGRCRHIGRCPPESALFRAKSSHFLPKTALQPIGNAKRRKTAGTLHMRLDLLESNSPLVPSDDTICPKNTPKRPPPKKGPRICPVWMQAAPNQERAVSWATWLKTPFQGHVVHPQPLDGKRHPIQPPHYLNLDLLDPPYEKQGEEAHGNTAPEQNGVCLIWFLENPRLCVGIQPPTPPPFQWAGVSGRMSSVFCWRCGAVIVHGKEVCGCYPPSPLKSPPLCRAGSAPMGGGGGRSQSDGPPPPGGGGLRHHKSVP